MGFRRKRMKNIRNKNTDLHLGPGVWTALSKHRCVGRNFIRNDARRTAKKDGGALNGYRRSRSVRTNKILLCRLKQRVVRDACRVRASRAVKRLGAAGRRRRRWWRRRRRSDCRATVWHNNKILPWMCLPGAGAAVAASLTKRFCFFFFLLIIIIHLYLW